ncbi:MAG: MBL fold metallo-hydrolase [Acidobacteria bacterium]|nr:MBL fold metallo-hydrolase [Acidobacteriota bacterium]
MASVNERLDENAAGEFYVDQSCIDCDTCRFVAPEVFARDERIEQSFVSRQPSSEAESERALMALVACPTSSIGTLSGVSAKAAAARFPEIVTENVYYCGYTAESSFGASSYLIERPDGNWMVDSPRAGGPLLKNIASMGGVKRMFLSHRDDVADHAKFARRFGCERVIHRLEARGALAAVETKLDLNEPTKIDDDLWAIPVPGHTEGSIAYLYRDKFLFSGDHLWWSPNVGALHASRRVCWYDWRRQIRSMERLLDFSFEWVLPGHGRRYQAESPRHMRDEIQALVRRMRSA